MGRSASFKETAASAEDALQARTAAQAGGSGSLLRSGRGLRLGLGAVTRTTSGSAKGRETGQGHKSAAIFSQPVQTVGPATNQKSQDITGKWNIIEWWIIRIPDGRGIFLAAIRVWFYVNSLNFDTGEPTFSPPLQRWAVMGPHPLQIGMRWRELIKMHSLRLILAHFDYSEGTFDAPEGCLLQNNINK